MEWIKRIEADEPARLRALWTAVVAVLAGVGVTVSADLSGWVEGGLLAAAALLPILQGEATRAKVTPAWKLDDLNEPEDEDEATVSDAPAEWLAQAGTAPGDTLPEAPITGSTP